MVLFNKQGKWFPPITHNPPPQKKNHAHSKTGISQSSMGTVSIWTSPKTRTYLIEADQPGPGPCQGSVNTRRVFDSPVEPNHSLETQTPPEQSAIIDVSGEPSQHTGGILGIHLSAVFNYRPGTSNAPMALLPKCHLTSARGATAQFTPDCRASSRTLQLGKYVNEQQ